MRIKVFRVFRIRVRVTACGYVSLYDLTQYARYYGMEQ